MKWCTRTHRPQIPTKSCYCFLTVWIKYRRHIVRSDEGPDNMLDFTAVTKSHIRSSLFLPFEKLSTFPPACSLLQLWAISFLFLSLTLSIFKSQISSQEENPNFLFLGFGGNWESKEFHQWQRFWAKPVSSRLGIITIVRIKASLFSRRVVITINLGRFVALWNWTQRFLHFHYRQRVIFMAKGLLFKSIEPCPAGGISNPRLLLSLIPWLVFFPFFLSFFWFLCWVSIFVCAFFFPWLLIFPQNYIDSQNFDLEISGFCPFPLKVFVFGFNFLSLLLITSKFKEQFIVLCGISRRVFGLGKLLNGGKREINPTWKR